MGAKAIGYYKKTNCRNSHAYLTQDKLELKLGKSQDSLKERRLIQACLIPVFTRHLVMLTAWKGFMGQVVVGSDAAGLILSPGARDRP